LTTTATDIRQAELVGRVLRTPRAAAIAGIAFSVLFAIALVLVHQAVPSEPKGAGTWLSDSSRRDAVLLALSLVPFAGIAFLWFIGVVRDRIGDAEDRFFATVFLGSGLLFVAMIFVAAAIAAGLVATAGEQHGNLVASSAWSVGRRATSDLMTIYAMRMAAVFTIATSTILLRTRIAPRWLIATGYIIGLVLLVAIDFSAWIELAFPAWVLVLSLDILIASFKRPPESGHPEPVGSP
jgi:hypothetical protein